MKYGRERMLLPFQFCSARILLTRPCLTVRRQPWNGERYELLEAYGRWLCRSSDDHSRFFTG
jgi:hypothetical protein